MTDTIYLDYLAEQQEPITQLAQQSDLFDVEPGPALEGGAPDRYILKFHATGLVSVGPGRVQEADRFDVGVWLHPGFLKQADPFPTLTLLSPHNWFHPNVRFPGICLQMRPAESLVSIAYALYALISYQKYQLLHGLNADAADYVRRHVNAGKFPTDPRPLKWQAQADQPVEAGGAA